MQEINNQTIAPRLHSIRGMYLFALDVALELVLNWAPKVILQLPWFVLPQLVTGHFRDPLDLCIKTRLGAQPLIWK